MKRIDTGPRAPIRGVLLTWFGVKSERCGVERAGRRRQLGLEEKGVDGALVLRWGPWKDLGLAQPGASLADAAADWMRGPPLTHCWRLELCVPGRPKPPLCLAVSLSLSNPPSFYLSLCLQFFFLLLSIAHTHHRLRCLQLHLLHTNPHSNTHAAKTLCADTHRKEKKNVHTMRTRSTKIISFKCSKANG